MDFRAERDCARFPDVMRFISDLRDPGAPGAGLFDRGREVLVARAPGRLDLMGGNDDYTGGLVFEATIREAVIAAVQAREDRRVVFHNPAVRELGWEGRIEFSLNDLVEGGKPRDAAWVRSWCESDKNRSWCAYIVGDLYYLLREHPDRVRHGFDLYLESDIPLGKGVSSSAAIEVAPMKAMAALYGLEARGVDLALWLPFNLRVWGVDSGVRHAVSGIEYEAARAATFMGYRILCEAEGLEPELDESGIVSRYIDPRWKGYLANLSPSRFREKYEGRLPTTMRGAEFSTRYGRHLDPHTRVLPEIDYPVLGATRYAVEENWRVNLFYRLVMAHPASVDEGTARLLGELMYQAHAGYTDCALASKATDLLVELARGEEARGILGAKVTGGGAGGTVAVLGYATEEAEEAFHRLVDRYRKESGLEPYIFAGSSPGADDFGVLKLRL
jgi:galactokinase